MTTLLWLLTTVPLPHRTHTRTDGQRKRAKTECGQSARKERNNMLCKRSVHRATARTLGATKTGGSSAQMADQPQPGRVAACTGAGLPFWSG